MSNLGFTCICCRVAFTTSELQRLHYKSDWHRYNLKRKVAEMPPLTADEFKQRVLAQQAQNAEAERDRSSYCKTCGKHFNSENSYANHLNSKKHKEMEAKEKRKLQSDVEKNNAKNREKGLDEDAILDNKTAEEMKEKPPSRSQKLSEEMEEDDDDEWEDVEEEPIPVTDCLFCSDHSESLEQNIDHMTKTHSFFIPHIEYLVNLEGLVEYLGDKVGCGHMCLWCNEKGKTFSSVEAVQTHMKAKGHAKLFYEGDAVYEYADFYDFRSSYPDNEEGAIGASEDDEDEIDEDEFALHHDGYELVLPSGARIGHRELFRYYKQNVPPTRAVAKLNPHIGRMVSQYKALGWTGSTGQAKSLQIKDMRYVQKYVAKQNLKNQMKNNKLKQHHFRPQVVF